MIIRRRLRSTCRRFAKPSLSKPASPRSFSNSVEKRKNGYVLPSHVIELDSADSPYVKKYEDMSEEEKEEKIFGISKRYQEQGAYEGEVHRSPWIKRKEVINIDSVTQVRVMNYLLHARVDPKTKLPVALSSWIPQTQSQLEPHYKVFGIEVESPFRQDIKNLLRNLELDNAKGLSVRPDFERSAKKELLACTKFDILCRKITSLCQSEEGCQFISTHGIIIVRAIRGCRARGAIPPRSMEVSKFLITLTNTMIFKGFTPDLALCMQGLDYAAKSAAIPTMQKYLKIAHENGYEPTNYTRHIARIIKHSIDVSKSIEHTQTKGRTWTIWRDKSLVFNDVLTLVSGWESVEAAKRGAPRQPCFAMLFGPREEYHFEYLYTLAQIGAGDMLWHEWTLNDTEVDILARGSDTETKQKRAQHFILALLSCNEVTRARQIFASYPDLKPKFASTSTLQLSPEVVNALSPKVAEVYESLGIKESDGIRMRMWSNPKFNPNLPTPMPEQPQQMSL